MNDITAPSALASTSLSPLEAPPPAGAALLDGKALADRVVREVRAEVDRLVQAGQRPPGLAIVLVGDDPASHVYVRNKSRACQKAGIRYLDHSLPAETSGEALLALVDSLNRSPEVDGILVQLPLPPALKAVEAQVIALIDPHKDVDGFHMENVGLLHIGTPRFVSCTPAGVMSLLRETGQGLSGKHAVVIGRSNIVGKPVAALLTQQNATVTLCHSRTVDLDAHVARADVVVAAVGMPKLIQGDWIKPGAIVIDVGINRLDGKLVGDVDFEAARAKASFLTPVPGGVGPMTIAELMRNCLKARLARPNG